MVKCLVMHLKVKCNNKDINGACRSVSRIYFSGGRIFFLGGETESPLAEFDSEHLTTDLYYIIYCNTISCYEL